MKVGTRIKIVGTHPHAEKTGKIDRYEVVAISRSGKKFPVVKTDDGAEFFVFDRGHIMVIE